MEKLNIALILLFQSRRSPTIKKVKRLVIDPRIPTRLKWINLSRNTRITIIYLTFIRVQTLTRASRKIPEVIFEVPASRSIKTMGYSIYVKPFLKARIFNSIWIVYPLERRESKGSVSKILRLQKLKPPVISRMGHWRIIREYSEPQIDIRWRAGPQP